MNHRSACNAFCSSFLGRPLILLESTLPFFLTCTRSQTIRRQGVAPCRMSGHSIQPHTNACRRYRLKSSDTALQAVHGQAGMSTSAFVRPARPTVIFDAASKKNAPVRVDKWERPASVTRNASGICSERNFERPPTPCSTVFVTPTWHTEASMVHAYRHASWCPRSRTIPGLHSCQETCGHSLW